MRLGESPRMFPPAFGKRPSPLPLSREGRGVRTLILASLLPLREKDRMRGKQHTVRIGLRNDAHIRGGAREAI